MCVIGKRKSGSLKQMGKNTTFLFISWQQSKLPKLREAHLMNQ
jgi:hypothetical protein